MAKLPEWSLDAERELWAAICAPNRWFDETGKVTTHPDSLWYFVHLVWGAEWYFRGSYAPGPDTKRRWLTAGVHRPYISWLQKQRLEWKESRRAGRNERWMVATIIPRAFGKTVIATKCAPLWCHLDEPDMSTLFASATSDLSIDILKSIHQVISGKNEFSWFCWLYGNWRDPERDWTQRYSHHGYRQTTSLSEPSLDTTAVDIGMTGYHHDDHEWDDPIIRNKLREGGIYMEGVHAAFNASYPALKQDGWLGMTLTPYLDDDIRGRHLKEEGVLSWDGLPPPDERLFERHPLGRGKWRVYFFQMEDELTGQPLAPDIITADEIARWKALDPEDFACQGQCNPGTSDRAPILESQIRDLFVDYATLRHEIPISHASVHIDTAFKNKRNVGQGDFNAIIPWLHDVRPLGIVYLHTDLIRHSNEWRSEQFSDELIKVMHILRRQQYRVRHLTDEVEPGGKEGMYKNQLTATLRGAGFAQWMPKIVQFNRQGTQKEARIRKAAGFWADGYVRILLHKDKKGEWIIPPVVRTLINQMVRIDIIKHNDLADAAADVFMPACWRPPSFESWITSRDEGMPVRAPLDENLKAMSRPITNEELKAMMDGQEFVEQLGPGRGMEEEWLPSRDEIMWER